MSRYHFVNFLFSSGSHLVQQSRTICTRTRLIESTIRSISVNDYFEIRAAVQEDMSFIMYLFSALGNQFAQ